MLIGLLILIFTNIILERSGQMSSKRNKTKLSIVVLNLFVLNVLTVQPVQALISGSGYIAVVSGNDLTSTPQPP